MGYAMLDDGQCQFNCRACAKTKVERSKKALPKGWFISGILGNVVDPEFGDDENDTPADTLKTAASTLADYFCSLKCGRKYLSSERIVAKVNKLGVRLVLWGQCELVVDGTPLPEEDQKLNEALFGDEEPKGKRKKKTEDDDDDDEPRPGSPPPYTHDGGAI